MQANPIAAVPLSQSFPGDDKQSESATRAR
jgi:hypothetical protein